MSKTLKIKLFAVLIAVITLLSCTFVSPYTRVSLPQVSALTEEQTMTKTEYEHFVKDLEKFPINFIYDDIYFSGFHPLYFTEISRSVKTEGNKELTTIILKRDILEVKIEFASIWIKRRYIKKVVKLEMNEIR